jgi:hypothetical protein
MYASETHYSRAISYNGLGIDAGVQYVQPTGSNSRLTVGAGYSMSALLKGKSINVVSGEGMAGSSTYSDITYTDTVEEKNLSYPNVARMGISYERYNQFIVGADFSCSWWNKESIDITYRASLGIEMPADLRSNFWMRRLSYRIGANWQTYKYGYAGGQLKLNSFGISAGIGIPVRRSRSNIYIFGEYSRTGSLKQGQIEQNMGRIGVSFSSVETWFVKRKYD